MSNFKKAAIPTFIAFAIYAFIIFSPTKEIGNFDAVRSAGEINQSVHVYVVPEKGFERDQFNRIVTFFARDRNNSEAIVSLNEPAPAELENAEVVEIFGHMHGNNFKATRLTIFKLKE